MSRRRPVPFSWPAWVTSLTLLGFVAPPPTTACAQVPDAELPVIDAPVTDLAEVVGPRTERWLDRRLRAHRAATGVQLAILVVDTTGGEPIEDYALRVASRWGGGTATQDAGILYVLAVRDRRQRLEVGYGAEASIPDSLAAHILAGVTDALREGRYNDATVGVAQGVMSYTSDVRPTTGSQGLGVRHPMGWFSAALTYFALLAMGYAVGTLQRRRRVALRTEEVALGVEASRDWATMLVMVLSPVVAGTAAGLLGLGWFHYAGVIVGLLAGWRSASDSLLSAFASVFIVGVTAVLFTTVVTGLSGDLWFGVLVGFAAQIFAVISGSGSEGGGTRFSGVGTNASRDDITHVERERRRASRADALASSIGGSSSFAKSGFGSSSSGFGSSSSSSRSSSSSGYGGGGGRFGGGGASASW